MEPVWARLHKLVERHEAFIQSRWRVKTREQRKNIRLTVKNDLPTCHRPDMRRLDLEWQEVAPAYDKWAVVVIPHMNLEDLMDDEKILLWLNSRARYHPERFVYWEFQVPGERALPPHYLPEYKLMLYGQIKPGSHGTVVTWKKGGSTENSFRMDLQPPFGPGFGILTIQDVTLVFLLRSVRKVCMIYQSSGCESQSNQNHLALHWTTAQHPL